MFKESDQIYTDNTLLSIDGLVAFKSYVSYRVYEIYNEHNVLELALINELDMFHALRTIQEQFKYVQ